MEEESVPVMRRREHDHQYGDVPGVLYFFFGESQRASVPSTEESVADLPRVAVTICVARLELCALGTSFAFAAHRKPRQGILSFWIIEGAVSDPRGAVYTVEGSMYSVPAS